MSDAPRPPFLSRSGAETYEVVAVDKLGHKITAIRPLTPRAADAFGHIATHPHLQNPYNFILLTPITPDVLVHPAFDKSVPFEFFTLDGMPISYITATHLISLSSTEAMTYILDALLRTWIIPPLHSPLGNISAAFHTSLIEYQKTYGIRPGEDEVDWAMVEWSSRCHGAYTFFAFVLLLCHSIAQPIARLMSRRASLCSLHDCIAFIFWRIIAHKRKRSTRIAEARQQTTTQSLAVGPPGYVPL